MIGPYSVTGLYIESVFWSALRVAVAGMVLTRGTRTRPAGKGDVLLMDAFIMARTSRAEGPDYSEGLLQSLFQGESEIDGSEISADILSSIEI